MNFFYFILPILVSTAPTDKPHTLYDQKQTGDYNIQVHLKDIQIIALLGEDSLGDYDYNYDYSDFTVKPSAGNVTSKPPPLEETNTSSSTSKPDDPSTSISTTKKTENSSITTEKTEPATSSTNSPDRIKVQIIEEPNPVAPTDDLAQSNVPALSEVLHYRRCASGYTRDKRGRCRRVRRPSHQHQFDIGRLASNLAARIRGSTDEDSIASSRTIEK